MTIRLTFHYLPARAGESSPQILGLLFLLLHLRWWVGLPLDLLPFLRVEEFVSDRGEERAEGGRDGWFEELWGELCVREIQCQIEINDDRGVDGCLRCLLYSLPVAWRC